jgi:hypothetical protein
MPHNEVRPSGTHGSPLVALDPQRAIYALHPLGFRMVNWIVPVLTGIVLIVMTGGPR